MGDHALGEEGAGGEHRAEALQRGRLLVEQGEVDRTARHRMHEAQQAHEAAQRLGLRRGRGEDRRHHAIEPLARARRHGAQGAAAEQAFQFGARLPRAREARACEGRDVDAVAERRGAPERRPCGLLALRIATGLHAISAANSSATAARCACSSSASTSHDGCPSASAMRSRVAASAGISCVCWSPNICTRFSSRRRNDTPRASAVRDRRV